LQSLEEQNFLSWEIIQTKTLTEKRLQFVEVR